MINVLSYISMIYLIFKSMKTKLRIIRDHRSIWNSDYIFEVSVAINDK